jgi:hypothetical protein
MFLPVLLVRDFGIWGYVVFVVPNVLGAAAMGWVLRSPSASVALVHHHQAACALFSLVTMSFQAFFFMFLLGNGAFRPAAVWVCLVPMAAAVVGCGGRTATRLLGAGALLAFSLVAFAAYLLRGEPAIIASTGARSIEVAWLAPVCAFGFGLCPYLDLTFHRARRALPGSSSPAAFGVGFGVFFLAMILFTLAYSAWIDDAIRGGRPDLRGPRVLVLAHLVGQLLYTFVLHLRETEPFVKTPRRAAPGTALAALLTVLASVLLAVAVMGAGTTASGWVGGLSSGELTYRLFMAFYGLVFPAYVWLCVIPTRDEPVAAAIGGRHAGPPRQKLLLWCFAVGLAAPMYWMAFIERQTWWLVPGLGVVLVARLFLPRRAGLAPA